MKSLGFWKVFLSAVVGLAADRDARAELTVLSTDEGFMAKCKDSKRKSRWN